MIASFFSARGLRNYLTWKFWCCGYCRNDIAIVSETMRVSLWCCFYERRPSMVAGSSVYRFVGIRCAEAFFLRCFVRPAFRRRPSWPGIVIYSKFLPPVLRCLFWLFKLSFELHADVVYENGLKIYTWHVALVPGCHLPYSKRNTLHAYPVCVEKTRLQHTTAHKYSMPNAPRSYMKRWGRRNEETNRKLGGVTRDI